MDNWFRWYLPPVGRYLSPEPMLQDPSWVQQEAAAGFTTPTYAYASNNPVVNVDPTGLYTVDGDCNVPKSGRAKADLEDAAREIAKRITDGPVGERCIEDELRKCVLKQIDDMVVTCNGNTRTECKKPTNKGAEIIAYASLGRCNAANHFVGWCNNPLAASTACMAEALVHEAAHNCGWSHGDGRGVPGNDGFICGGAK
jgi:RHS repeat-associated protein